MEKALRRILLDSRARTPLDSKVVTDEQAALTTIVVTSQAPGARVKALAKRVKVIVSPGSERGVKTTSRGAVDLRWLLKILGAENVTNLLVEGGGEVNASFLLGGHAHRIAFFYAPKILGGRDARKGVAGEGAAKLSEALRLRELEWKRVGDDLMLTARVDADRE